MNKYNLNEQELDILNNQIIEQYCKCFNIDINYNITPEFQNNWGKYTIAMWLTYSEKCLVPKQWMHNYNITKYNKKTLKDLVIQEHIPLTCEYQDINKMSIFDKAYFGIIPDINGHKSDDQDEQGFTVAMILAHSNINIPTQWYHKPELQNDYGQTVAMILAEQEIMPPRECMHNYDIKNVDGRTLKDYLEAYYLPVPYHWRDDDMTIFDKACYGEIPQSGNHKPDEQNEGGQTVAMILAISNKEIPSKWQHDPKLQDKKGHTVAMYQAAKGKIPDKYWEHKSDLQDKDGWTVAMYLANNRIIPTQYWHHEPLLQNEYKETVAMKLASKGIIPPREWQHQPELQDYFKYTVAMNLALNSIIPPKEWCHDPLLNFPGQTVAGALINKGILPPKELQHVIYSYQIYNDQYKQLLLDNGYIRKDGDFIPPDFKAGEVLSDTCQICFTEGEQKFVKTTCGHKICYECFKQLYKNDNHKQCPICRREDWTYIQQLDQDSDNESDSSYDSSDGSDNNTSSYNFNDSDDSSNSSTFSSNTSSTDSDSNDSTDSSDDSEF